MNKIISLLLFTVILFNGCFSTNKELNDVIYVIEFKDFNGNLIKQEYDASRYYISQDDSCIKVKDTGSFNVNAIYCHEARVTTRKK